MPLQTRILRVTFSVPEDKDYIFDQTAYLNVQLSKSCLKPQQTAKINIFNMTQELRDNLLSHMTEWNLREIQHPGRIKKDTNILVKVKIEAGYLGGDNSSLSTIFSGEVTTTALTSSPPNIGILINAMSLQIDKLKDSVEPPHAATYKEYAQWVADQLEVRLDCKTSYDNIKIKDLFTSVVDVSGLMWALQDAWNPRTVAYVDNKILTVRDYDKPLDAAASNPITVNEFIGIPTQTSFGASFQTLFDPKIHLSAVIHLNSKMNPSLGTEKIKTNWLVAKMDYMLSSREIPFYVKADVYPAGAQ